MAVVKKPILSNNEVINVILIDENVISSWDLPEGQIFGNTGGNVGDIWNGNNYISISSDNESPISNNDVEIERKKRIITYLQETTGKTYDWYSAYEIINEGTREATTLLNIKVKYLMSNTNPDWTLEQSNRATELETFSSNIDYINNKAYILKTTVPIPTDYKDNSYWE